MLCIKRKQKVIISAFQAAVKTNYKYSLEATFQQRWHVWGRGHLSVPLCPAATQRPVTATAAISRETRAHLAYISVRRAWLSTIISADASMAMLSTALRVQALRQVTAGHCCVNVVEAGVIFTIFTFIQSCLLEVKHTVFPCHSMSSHCVLWMLPHPPPQKCQGVF